jgi:prolyl-tRNA synthetase
MNIETLLGRRIADDPKDAQTPGHRLLLRGGYIRQVGQGIYSLLPLALRACRKVERIIREEMDAIGGQEVLLPVTSPAELWMESGRYEAVGPELLRFTDRNDHPCVLNMTHEEIVTDLVRGNVDSYRQLPLMVYQIQTKFRDEARSRGGLIRVREFTMKDAYSFHRTVEDLQQYYKVVHEAYVRIFRRCGLRKVLDIESDTGMMGGMAAHEFMLLSPVGEDTILYCEESGYRANREVAICARKYDFSEEMQPLTEVHTPGTKTIEELCNFLMIAPERTGKCVAFVGDGEKKILAFVRGDLEVNQAKLKRAAKVGDLRPMQESEFTEIGTIAGFVGPQGLDRSKVTLIIDESVAKTPNTVVGANKADTHATGFNVARELGADFPFHDITDVREGDPCPECGKPLKMARGIEVGNIFQLGTKYTKAMNFTYDEEDASQRTPIMGCYGIGVGRTMASAVEESNDEKGPIWPISIAPFEVQICCLQAKDEEIREAGQRVYEALRGVGLDPLLDRRNVGAGFMFADADLIGAPVRVILSRRNLAAGKAELKYRLAEERTDLPTEAPLDTVEQVVREVVQTLKQAYA